MKTVRPSFQILWNDDPVEMLLKIERIARVCYKSEDKICEGSARRLIANLIKRGHGAMLEHGSFTVVFTMDRGVTHEAVRHRCASYAQESTRYVNYQGEGLQVVDLAGGISLCPKTSKLPAETIQEIYTRWYRAMMFAEQMYMEMIELGATPQIARSVLPTSTKAEIVVTANLREWRHILDLRTATDAHPQFREITVPLLRELKRQMPIIFDDMAIPEDRKQI